ncbi:glycoside hydrolase family 113 [Portibacter lacus]|uniref:Glycoside hydrolase n=1 Tax=Portibacter lacus TaxID=1099794 RepID=A0AA37WFF2_9BACT|nr:hypothetical protein [Portibacter lacus]GLR18522.1 hypothetical protein GCM10007940_31380 [Portibacter lacus]
MLGIGILAASFINIDLEEKDVEGPVAKYDFKKEPKIKGLTFVAPPRPFSENPMPYIQSVNAEWIAVIPYGFIPKDDHKVAHGSERQWWGEREEGVVETITKAHESGLRVMIKPQIWMHGSWIGDFTLDNDKHWQEWEETYSKYILQYARIAQEQGVDMLCIGTEFKKAMQDNSDYWYHLIDQIRAVYDGPLTYSSNWDEYKDVPIWDKLDYIGISAYFPLTDEKEPSHATLKKEWKPVVKELERFANKHKKKIIFTEFGYLSVDGCAGKTWILEKERDKHNQNQKAQADAFHCLFSTFWDEDWWAGGFFWKWYPEMRPNRKDFYNKDYSPQGKLAEKTIAEWYGKR